MDHWKQDLPHETDIALVSSYDLLKKDSNSSELVKRNFLGTNDKEAKRTVGVSFEERIVKPSFRSPKIDQNYAFRKFEEKGFEKAISVNLCESRNYPQEHNLKLSIDSITEGHESGFSDKENKSPNKEDIVELQEYLKKHIIQNFLLNNDTNLKTTLENVRKDADKKNQLHIHHHEHHHHYYFDDGTLTNVKTQNIEIGKSPRQRKPTGRSMNAYFLSYPNKSTATYSKESNISKSGTIFKSGMPETDKNLVNGKSSALSGKVSKNFSTKSPLVRNHIYSEIDSRYCKIYEDADQISEMEKIVQKVSLSKNSVEATFHSTRLDNEDIVEPEPPNSAENVQALSVFEERNKSWKANVKEELKNIKKDLQRIQKKHMTKKMQEKSGPNQISIYSNKTFIVGNEKLLLKKKRKKIFSGEGGKETPEIMVDCYVANPELNPKERMSVIIKKQ